MPATTPGGLVPRDDIVACLEKYTATAGATVRTGLQVKSVERDAHGAFMLQRSTGNISASVVVLATGAYQRPHRPGAST